MTYAKFQITSIGLAESHVYESLRTARESGQDFNERKFLLRMFDELKNSPYGLDKLRDAAEDQMPYCHEGRLQVPNKGMVEAVQRGDECEIGRIIIGCWLDSLDLDLMDFYESAKDELEREAAA